MAPERDDFVLRVARRISALRVERGITQEGLASALDIATKNVQRLESGKQNLTLRTIERIASALGVAPEVLVVSPKPASTPPVPLLVRLAAAGYPVRVANAARARPPGTVPVTNLRAAAGMLDAGARAVNVLGWVTLKRPPTAEQFVAEVEGSSMEPRIRAHDICLFSRPVHGPLDGRVLLVEHRTIADADLGGAYALKRVKMIVLRDGRRQVKLLSDNPRFAPIVVTLDEDDELTVVAELVRVLAHAPA